MVRMTAGQLIFILPAICVQLIPLFLIMILRQTAPFWAALLSYFINKEPLYRSDFLAMAVCFAGVLAIAITSED